MTDRDRQSFETRVIHAGYDPDPETGAVMPPIHPSATFAQDAPGDDRGYEYARTGNPTRSILEANLADLEGGAFGRAFASGMAAITSVLHLLEPGDHVVVGRDVYGGTHRLFTQVYALFGVTFTFVDVTDLIAVRESMRPETALVWVETPTNPLLRIVDIGALASTAHEHGALLAVDNTFATPYLQRPLEHGADIVAHSLTKYIGGHSDIVAGAILVDRPEFDERLGFYQNSAGAIPGPFTAYQVLRGIKTLPVRMDRHCANARAVAEWLVDHPDVHKVHYPGLSSHDGHRQARTQMDNFGGMVSFEHRAPDEEVRTMVSRTEIFTLAESLGGVESLIEHPAAMTHASIPNSDRDHAGLPDGLVRLSVGIEDVEDLIADLAQAMDG